MLKDFLFFLHLKQKNDIKNNKVLYFWSLFDPIFLMIILYFIFNNEKNNNFFAFLLIGKFCYVLFIKFFNNFSNLLDRNKNNYNVNINLNRLIFIDSFFELIKNFPFILGLMVYCIFFLNFSISIFFDLIFIIFSIIIISISTSFFFKYLEYLNHSFLIVNQTLPLYLLFASGIFFEIGDVNNIYFKLLLELNPLSILIANLRSSILMNANIDYVTIILLNIFFLLLFIFTIKILIKSKYFLKKFFSRS